ncbi:ABC transporter [Actinomyces respiraculi]|uniref:ABC transporter n=2 Tax=Actinomyces TaxID=1654 RepID=A0A7T0PWJ1_9ACTO|nr:ABC transporter [Actinomyces respiraculi]QPL05528.1 ABC transporter [Actinomyces respiraculi]
MTAVVQPTIRWRDTVRSEITKITTHPATFLMLVIAVAANLLLAAIDASGVTFYTGDPSGPSSLSDFGVVMIAPLYAFLVIPVWAAATEYHGGQLRMSLSATPQRGRFILAKLAATLTIVSVAAVVAIVPARLVVGVTDGMGPVAVLMSCIQWTVAYVLMSLVAFGLAGILKNTVAPLGIMIALPVVIATGILQWPDGLRFLPDQAALSLVGTPQFDVHEIPPPVAAAVLVIWACVAVAAYAFSVTRSDA